MAVQTRLDKGDSLGHANDAEGPALFITGGDDWNIIDQQQEAFAAALKLKGFDAESIVIPGGGHGFDEGGSGLSKLGEQSAKLTLQWLNDNFPQTPAREAQVAPIDVNNLPDATGTPPTTYQPRTAPAGGYVGGTRSTGIGSGIGLGIRLDRGVVRWRRHRPRSRRPRPCPPPPWRRRSPRRPTTAAPADHRDAHHRHPADHGVAAHHRHAAHLDAGGRAAALTRPRQHDSGDCHGYAASVTSGIS